jgi:putative transposase
VWLTRELFEFIEFTNPTPHRKELKLRIGTAKHPVGILEFTAHRDFMIPDSIHLSVQRFSGGSVHSMITSDSADRR